MADARFMKITKCIESLLHDHSCLTFSEVLLLGNVVKEFSTLAQPNKNLGLDTKLVTK